jgi:hypothetical protein
MSRTLRVLIVFAVCCTTWGPFAVAHLTAESTPYDGTDDSCRGSGAPPPLNACIQHTGLSGTYRGAATIFLASDGFPLDPDGPNGIHDPPGDILAPMCEIGYCAVAIGANCDAEWVAEGVFEGNELIVEGDVAQIYGGGVLIPDGLWDDGGEGAACHTNNGPGGFSDWGWNTDGCGLTLWAKDADPLIGTSVWLANFCDSTILIGGSHGFFDCLTNRGVAGEAGLASAAGDLPSTSGVPEAVATLSTCATNSRYAVAAVATGFINGLPLGGGPVAPATECGTDGQADAATFGSGGGSGVLSPTPAKATLPSPGTDCAIESGEHPLQSGVVYNYVGPASLQFELLATTGWIN